MSVLINLSVSVALQKRPKMDIRESRADTNLFAER